jgi:lipopolysaccharide export system protein LptA
MRSDVRRIGRRQLTKAGVALALLFCLAAPASIPADSFSFSSDSTSIVLAEGEERTVLSGNARVVSEDTTIRAERIEIYGEDFRYAQAGGGVMARDEEQGIELDARTLFFDRQENVLRAEGQVTMEDTENDVVVKGEFVENRGEESITIIQVGVRMFGEDFTARSEFARYRRDDNVVELSGLPIVYWEDDTYEATRIVVNLDTDEITLEGQVQGSIVTEEEEDESSAEGGAQSGDTGLGGGGGQ